MWYAQLPARRTAQIVTDLAVLAWCVGWAWAGRAIHDLVAAVAVPARQIASTGTDFQAETNASGARLGDLPLVGDRIEAAFTGLSSTGAQVSSVGTDIATTFERLALALGWTTALAPILLAVVPWLVMRIGFVRRAAAARRSLDAAGDLDLFALRALARQPMHRLVAIDPDPATAWRAGDRAVLDRLAALELRASGLRPPAPTAPPGGRAA